MKKIIVGIKKVVSPSKKTVREVGGKVTKVKPKAAGLNKPTPIESSAVKSSNLKHVSYDSDRRELTIVFNYQNSRYVYSSVNKRVYTNLINATSKGKYFDRNIKDKYQFRKLS